MSPTVMIKTVVRIIEFSFDATECPSGRSGEWEGIMKSPLHHEETVAIRAFAAEWFGSKDKAARKYRRALEISEAFSST